MAQPMSATIWRKRSSGTSVTTPGIASILSSVPPVWPRPRPEIIGFQTPMQASIGARRSEVQSPRPPVECLSTTRPGRSQRITSPESRMESVRATRSGVVRPLRQAAIAKAPACASVTAPEARPRANQAISSSVRRSFWRSFQMMPRASIQVRTM
jgi:hypothetical protein